MTTDAPDEDRLLIPGEVAKLFRVDVKTVARWGDAGLIPVFRTPGGHRRYREADVRRVMEECRDTPFTNA